MIDVPFPIKFQGDVSWTHSTRNQHNIFEQATEELPICKPQKMLVRRKYVWNAPRTAVVHVKARGQPDVWFLDEMGKPNEKKDD